MFLDSSILAVVHLYQAQSQNVYQKVYMYLHFETAASWQWCICTGTITEPWLQGSCVLCFQQQHHSSSTSVPGAITKSWLQSLHVLTFSDSSIMALVHLYWCNHRTLTTRFTCTLFSDSSITAALRLYQAQSQNLMLELGERNYKVYTDFLFSTFFTHFQLYKYVLSQPRRENIPQVGLWLSSCLAVGDNIV